MANSMRLLACFCMLLLTACHSHPRVKPVHHHFMYKGQTMSNTAVFVLGGGEVSTKLTDQVVADLEAQHVHAENVMDIVRISKNNADLVRQLKEMGFTEVLTIFSESKREDSSVAGYSNFGSATVYGNTISASSFSVPLVVHKSSMTIDAQLYTVDSEKLWETEVGLSSRGIGRGGRLIRGLSSRIVGMLKGDGLIVTQLN